MAPAHMVVVYPYCYRNESDCLLILLNRSVQGSTRGPWNGFSGMVKTGENAFNAARHTLRIEAPHVAATNPPLRYAARKRVHLDDACAGIIDVFMVPYRAPATVRSYESDAFAWFQRPPEENTLYPGDRQLLELLFRGRIASIHSYLARDPSGKYTVVLLGADGRIAARHERTISEWRPGFWAPPTERQLIMEFVPPTNGHIG